MKHTSLTFFFLGLGLQIFAQTEGNQQKNERIDSLTEFFEANPDALIQMLEEEDEKYWKPHREKHLAIASKLSSDLIPGVGIDRVIIGANISTVIDILGPPTEIDDIPKVMEQVKSPYIEIDTISSIPFYLGFDQVYSFRNKNKFGVYQVWTENKIVIAITFSYIFTMIELGIEESLRIRDMITYFSSREEIIRTMGERVFSQKEEVDPFFASLEPDRIPNESLWYFDTGLVFHLRENKNMSFVVFKPFNETQTRNFKNRINGK